MSIEPLVPWIWRGRLPFRMNESERQAYLQAAAADDELRRKQKVQFFEGYVELWLAAHQQELDAFAQDIALRAVRIIEAKRGRRDEDGGA